MVVVQTFKLKGDELEVMELELLIVKVCSYSCHLHLHTLEKNISWDGSPSKYGVGCFGPLWHLNENFLCSVPLAAVPVTTSVYTLTDHVFGYTSHSDQPLPPSFTRLIANRQSSSANFSPSASTPTPNPHSTCL